MSIFFSIITSTRNRKHELDKLIKSLKRQNFKNFEWIIGDDCSSDGTEEFIKTRIKYLNFKVTYLKSSHRIGLSKMINELIRNVKGKTFLLCDSDDYFKPSALSDAYKLFNGLTKKEKKNLVGILSGNVDEHDNNQLFYKDKIPKKNFFLKWQNVHKYCYGDGTLIAYSSYFKKLKLPEVDFYIPMSSIYKKYEKKNILITNKIFKIMKRNTSESISFQKRMAYNRGNAYAISICETGNRFENRTLISKMRLILNYFRYCFHGDIEISKCLNLWKVIKNNKILSVFYILALPVICYDLLFKKIDKTHKEFFKNIKSFKIIKKI